MNYHNIEYDSMLNGEGLRICLFCSGCHFHCKGCQNQQTWDFESGIPFDKEAENEFFNAINKDYISGTTYLGGEPLAPENRLEIARLIKKQRELLPNKTIWLYTGYTYEQIQKMADVKAIVDMVDVLCEGPFIEALKDEKIHYVGSSNQRVIDIPKTLDKNEIVLYN